MDNNKPCIITYIALITIVFFILTIIFRFKITISRNGDDKNMTITNKGGLRPSCLLCVRKHISQAIVLLSESKKGYPEHRWIAMGHLAEAEDESMKEHAELANQIRDARLDIQNGKNVNLVSFYKKIDSL